MVSVLYCAAAGGRARAVTDPPVTVGVRARFSSSSTHGVYTGHTQVLGIRVSSYQLNNKAPTADAAARKSCVHLSVHLYALTELSSFFFFASAIKGFRCSGMSTLGGILTGRMRTLTNSA